ncbi:hypothetical protein BDV23DRAFT_182242 [Aspergillus alliaceus]|uniref:Amino acid permease-domain-containing protein n=2 Tax=Petromyces alliaceus TaxID=209559 RepID=A0A5N7CC16_PETAA|nr:hypothetical protein BDV23DRAFT_182242 [Aspergillus alliaceus]
MVRGDFYRDCTLPDGSRAEYSEDDGDKDELDAKTKMIAVIRDQRKIYARQCCQSQITNEANGPARFFFSCGAIWEAVTAQKGIQYQLVSVNSEENKGALEYCQTIVTTGSVDATTAMQSAIILIGFVFNIAVIASVSRLTWTFARDGGLPYSKFFAQVIPIRATCLVCFNDILLSLVKIASTTALSAILALITSSNSISHNMPTAMMARKRVRKERIVSGPFALGRWDLAINLYNIIFGIFICTFVSFPTEIPVTATNMN